MFGLNTLFRALGKLTAEVELAADLFRAANDEMAQRLRIDDAPTALPAPEPEGEERNGRAKARR